MPAFVITLPQYRPRGIDDFKIAWKARWPELNIRNVTGTYSETGGRGLTYTISKSLKAAYYEYNTSHAYFFEDDARPFFTNLAENRSIDDRVQNLLSNWEVGSPVLFLGGHNVQNVSQPNLSSGLTPIKYSFGTYGWVVRRQEMLQLAKICDKALKSKGPISPDVLFSQSVGKNDDNRIIRPVIATPLLVDHLSGQFSVTHHKNRSRSCWEGVDEWWKVRNEKSSSACSNHATSKPVFPALGKPDASLINATNTTESGNVNSSFVSAR